MIGVDLSKPILIPFVRIESDLSDVGKNVECIVKSICQYRALQPPRPSMIERIYKADSSIDKLLKSNKGWKTT